MTVIAASSDDERRLARSSDPVTSHMAAEAIAASLTDLQKRVYGAYLARGPMTAKEAERMERFKHLAPSTVRKRTSELHEKGLIEAIGVRDRCSIYRAVVPTDYGQPKDGHLTEGGSSGSVGADATRGSGAATT